MSTHTHHSRRRPHVLTRDVVVTAALALAFTATEAFADGGRRSSPRSIDDRPNLVRTSDERRRRAPRGWRPRLTDDDRPHFRTG